MPHQGRQRGPLGFAQVRVAAGLVLDPIRAAVWGGEPEDTHKTVAWQPDALPTLSQSATLERAQALPAGVDASVALEARTCLRLARLAY